MFELLGPGTRTSRKLVKRYKVKKTAKAGRKRCRFGKSDGKEKRAVVVARRTEKKNARTVCRSIAISHKRSGTDTRLSSEAS